MCSVLASVDASGYQGSAMVTVERKLSGLRPEIEELKRVFKIFSASYCTSGLYTRKVHFLDHLVEDFKRFTSIPFSGAAPFQHLNVLNKQPYRIKAQRLCTRLQETVHTMESAMCRVRVAGGGVYRSLCVATVPETQQHLETGGKMFGMGRYLFDSGGDGERYRHNRDRFFTGKPIWTDAD